MILTIIGLMSGTSMDGIDAVIMKTDGQEYIEQIDKISINYNHNFHILLRTVEYAIRNVNGNLEEARQKYKLFLDSYLNSQYNIQEIEKIKINLSEYLYDEQYQEIRLEDIIEKSTILHAEVIKNLIQKASIQVSEIDLIGYHGQTFYHNPIMKISIILGDGQLLADMTGMTVINDFRSNDIRNGGEGAPLAPIYHRALAIKDKNYPIALVNCGGIANITIINGKSENDIIGFDTGPGSVLIDRYMRIKTANEELMDENGKYGLKGKIDPNILNLLKKYSIIQNNENYLGKVPPKSLDSSNFHLPEEIMNIKLEDACATLEFFTAETIVKSLKLLSQPIPNLWLLCGGGWNNPVVTDFLKKLLQKNVEVKFADEVGWDSKYMEAEIFAYLAARTIHKLPITIPQITHVKSPTLGGHAYIPQSITKSIEILLKNNPEILTGYL